MEKKRNPRGAGRHQLYGEPSKAKNIRYPISKESEFLKKVEEYLKQYRVNLPKKSGYIKKKYR